jgi:hypothetical protein
LTHFVNTAAEIETIKATLPAGVTDLVDNRVVHGYLTYPDRPFYSFVAAMEYCYSEMATPENLMMFGGGVLATICDAIADHEYFYLYFDSLFDDTTCFSDETIQEGMEFIIKVYLNLRLKDLCRKYNSRLSRTNTVGIRQSLAVNRKGNTREGKEHKRETELEEEELTEEELHLALENIAERGLDDEADEVAKCNSDIESDSVSTNGE